MIALGTLIKPLALTALLAWAPSTLAAAAPIDLSPRFESGASTSYEHHLRIEQSRRIELINDHKELTADLVRRLTVRVLHANDDGGASVELHFDRIKLDVIPPLGLEFHFDSDSPAPEDEQTPSERMFVKYMQSPLIFTLSAEGRVVGDIEGYDAFKKAVGPESGPQQFSTLFSESWLRATVEEVWSVSPDNPSRSLGETWAQRSVTRVGGVDNSDTSITYTLDAADDNYAHISGHGEIATEEDGAIHFEGSPATVTDQSLTFKLEWDLARGQLRRYSTTQTLDLAYPAMGVSATTKLVTRVNMRRVKNPS